MAGNSSYKKWHQPNKSDNAKTKQGHYIVKNIPKYVGDHKLVVYRSSWEFAFCKWCDYSTSVKRWSSEPLKIPYYDRVSNLDECKKYGLDPNNPRNWKVRNYYTDFWVEIERMNGLEKWFVEIKPAYKLKKPALPPTNAKLKDIKRYNMLAKEYLINEGKFASLNAWAKKHDMKFYVFTEDTLRKILGSGFFPNK